MTADIIDYGSWNAGAGEFIEGAVALDEQTVLLAVRAASLTNTLHVRVLQVTIAGNAGLIAVIDEATFIVEREGSSTTSVTTHGPPVLVGSGAVAMPLEVVDVISSGHGVGVIMFGWDGTSLSVGTYQEFYTEGTEAEGKNWGDCILASAGGAFRYVAALQALSGGILRDMTSIATFSYLGLVASVGVATRILTPTVETIIGTQPAITNSTCAGTAAGLFWGQYDGDSNYTAVLTWLPDATSFDSYTFSSPGYSPKYVSLVAMVDDSVLVVLADRYFDITIDGVMTDAVLIPAAIRVDPDGAGASVVVAASSLPGQGADRRFLGIQGLTTDGWYVFTLWDLNGTALRPGYPSVSGLNRPAAVQMLWVGQLWLLLYYITAPNPALELYGMTEPLQTLEPPLRLYQRNDGLGPAGHPRLQASQGASSKQLRTTPRLGDTNTYI